jgi:hypothetical protein
MAVLSSLVVCDDIVRMAAKEFSDGKDTANAQQSFARVLGGLDYSGGQTKPSQQFPIIRSLSNIVEMVYLTYIKLCLLTDCYGAR